MLLGFSTEIVRPVVAVPKNTLGLIVMVGADVPDANVGVASGTRTSIPESASNAMNSPELNFVKYTFVGVFNIFSHAHLDSIYKLHGRIVHISGIFY